MIPANIVSKVTDVLSLNLSLRFRFVVPFRIFISDHLLVSLGLQLFFHCVHWCNFSL